MTNIINRPHPRTTLATITHFPPQACKEQRAANFGQFQDLAIADPTLAVNCQQITRLCIEKFAEMYAMHIIFASDFLENWLMFNFKSIVKFIGKVTITFTLSPSLDFYESCPRRTETQTCRVTITHKIRQTQARGCPDNSHSKTSTC